MKWILIAIATTWTVINAHGQTSDTITAEEKSFLINYLELGASQLIGAIADLTQDQWERKPSPEAWSVGQCMSHILSAETGLFQNIMDLTKQPPDLDAPELRNQDAWLIGKICDRGIKVKTPLDEEPEAMTKKDALKAFSSSRAHIIQFVRDTDLPLRHFIGQSPYGPADTYQLLLVIAAHGMRHLAQMTDILETI